MGSINSLLGHSGQSLYTASKHALLGIVKCAALELGKYNIRVNAIGPGPIATEALLNFNGPAGTAETGVASKDQTCFLEDPASDQSVYTGSLALLP